MSHLPGLDSIVDPGDRSVALEDVQLAVMTGQDSAAGAGARDANPWQVGMLRTRSAHRAALAAAMLGCPGMKAVVDRPPDE